MKCQLYKVKTIYGFNFQSLKAPRFTTLYFIQEMGDILRHDHELTVSAVWVLLLFSLIGLQSLKEVHPKK